jgi:hypothetical protein
MKFNFIVSISLLAQQSLLLKNGHVLNLTTCQPTCVGTYQTAPYYLCVSAAVPTDMTP